MPLKAACRSTREEITLGGSVRKGSARCFHATERSITDSRGRSAGSWRYPRQRGRARHRRAESSPWRRERHPVGPPIRGAERILGALPMGGPSLREDRQADRLLGYPCGTLSDRYAVCSVCERTPSRLRGLHTYALEGGILPWGSLQLRSEVHLVSAPLPRRSKALHPARLLCDRSGVSAVYDDRASGPLERAGRMARMACSPRCGPNDPSGTRRRLRGVIGLPSCLLCARSLWRRTPYPCGYRRGTARRFAALVGCGGAVGAARAHEHGRQPFLFEALTPYLARAARSHACRLAFLCGYLCLQTARAFVSFLARSWAAVGFAAGFSG